MVSLGKTSKLRCFLCFRELGRGIITGWKKGRTEGFIPPKKRVYIYTYLSLQRAHEHALEDLARLVAVADVFEGFSCVLTAYIEEDFFAAAVFPSEERG